MLDTFRHSAMAMLLSVGAAVASADDTVAEREQQIKDASETWGKAIRDKDEAAMDRMLADDFLHVDTNGKASDKEETINWLMQANLSLVSIEQSDTVIRVYGENAVVTGRQVVTFKLNEEQGTMPVRDTACWVLEDNGWRLSVYQATPIR